MSENKQVDEYRKEWAVEVLKLLIERRGYLNEVLQVTRELNDSMGRNDRVSVQMLLKMRAEGLEKIDGTIRKLQDFKEQLGKETKEEIDRLLSGQQIEDQMAEMNKIIEIAKSCRKILGDIITIDKRMSRRVAGKDSFYET